MLDSALCCFRAAAHEEPSWVQTTLAFWGILGGVLGSPAFGRRVASRYAAHLYASPRKKRPGSARAARDARDHPPGILRGPSKEKRAVRAAQGNRGCWLQISGHSSAEALHQRNRDSEDEARNKHCNHCKHTRLLFCSCSWESHRFSTA